MLLLPRVTAPLVLAASLLLLTGCGGDTSANDSSPPASDTSVDEATDESVSASEAPDDETTVELGPAGGAVYTDPGAESVQVTVSPDGFAPASITVAVGETVTFTGADDGPHGLYVGDLDGYSVMGGITATYRFDIAGTYRVFDEISETEAVVLAE